MTTHVAYGWAVRTPVCDLLGIEQPLATRPSGEAIVRYASTMPLEGTTGDIAALSLWAGQSVALATRTQAAADIVAELVSRI